MLPVRSDAEEDQGCRRRPIADFRLLGYQEREDLADEVNVETACFQARTAEDLHQPLAEPSLAGLKLNGLYCGQFSMRCSVGEGLGLFCFFVFFF